MSVYRQRASDPGFTLIELLAFDMDLKTETAWLPGETEGRSAYQLPPFPCPKCGSTDTGLEHYDRQ